MKRSEESLVLFKFSKTEPDIFKVTANIFDRSWDQIRVLKVTSLLTGATCAGASQHHQLQNDPKKN
jgi:hypothetical protein